MEKYDFKEIEETTLKYWAKHNIYKKAKDKNKGKKKFYFLDGPPYTSGKVHIGTAWNKCLKDCVLRYKRMQGLDVWDRAGYDMHGLPIEHKVEKVFNIHHKEDIEKLGVTKFINECKKFSLKNLKMMNEDFIRLGVWMDFEDPYMSINNSFIEGEWWLVKKAHENKRLYEGERTMTWCPDCATALAKHELEYKEVKDNSIFLKFPIIGKDNEFLIIWTTTPWTIPFNLGVMVNPKLDYIRAKVDGEVWVVAKGLAGGVISNVADKQFEILETFKGESLFGVKYKHPFYDLLPIYKELEKKSDKMFTVLLSKEYVDLSAGSGLVHMAPGCGPEDYEVGHKNGIRPFNNLNEEGVFPSSMGPFAGLTAKKDDKKFIEELDKQGTLIATTEVEHDYAHCWRCHNPVIFRTTKQWFFKVEDLKGKMRKLNKKITWQPDWAGNRQFDSWLDNLRDNSITKQRYWGTPLPIWRCDKCKEYDVIGSIAELKKLAGKVPKDLHKPWIDEVKYKCKCGETKQRIPDILDVWVDAGTTSWNCLDYPHRKDFFNKLFPADFILEGKDQIRGWFNLLFVASMVSMDIPSFKSVYMHGFALLEGRKMSKSEGNYILPEEIINQYGADTLRYYSIGGANPGLDIDFNFKDIKTKNKNITVLWNIHNYLIDIAKTNKLKPSKPTKGDVEEQYILSRLNSTIKTVTEMFEEYKLNEIPWAVEELFLDLSRTYVQMVRDKVSVGSVTDKKLVFNTIYEVYFNILKLFAPIVPFITERIFLNLKEQFKLKEQTIHHFSWPKVNGNLINTKLEESMVIAKDIIQSTLASREKAQLGIRWPLKEAIVVTTDSRTSKAVDMLGDIIKTQTNVKNIVLKESMPEVKSSVRPDFSKLGPDFGPQAPRISKELNNVDADKLLKDIEKNSKFVLDIGGKEYDIVKEHIIVTKETPKGLTESEFKHGALYINTERTPKLDSEGYSREITRRIQELRKKAKLQKTDKIDLVIKLEDPSLFEQWKDSIKDKVSADKLDLTDKTPTGSYKNKSTEKIKGKVFELFF